MEYVIIGNGAAAIGAVEGIREIDKASPVTIVSAEPYRAYGRPLIANLLSGKIVEADIYYRADDFYEARGVKLLLGEKAARIDVEKKRVVLESGKAVSFGRLLIATGGIPFIPPIKGGEGSSIYTFTTLDDAKNLEALPGKVERVVVIGGGVMGMLHLLTAKRRGARVIMSEIDPRRRELAESFGCDVVFSPKETDPVEFVKKLTEGRGADVVFDTTAFPAVAAQAIEMTGKMGRCIMYSSIHPDDPLAVSANMLHNTERVITGSVSPSIASFDTAVRLLNKKLVDPSKLLSAVIPFEDAKKAFETAIRPDTYRVIIKF